MLGKQSRFLLGLTVILFLLQGCGILRSKATVNNQSQQPLEQVQLSVVDEQTRTLPLGTLAAGQSKTVTLAFPEKFGEAELRVDFTIGGKPYSQNCGYLEDSMYVSTITIDPSMAVKCEVKVSWTTSISTVSGWLRA